MYILHAEHQIYMFHASDLAHLSSVYTSRDDLSHKQFLGMASDMLLVGNGP